MKCATLFLVAGAPPRHYGRSAAAVDYRVLAERVRYGLELALLVLGSPFRLVAAVWRFGVAAGCGFFRALLALFFGTIGLALIGFVGFGLLRVLFHPLFR